MKDAKRILTGAGLVKSKKNANTILFTTIQRSERFKRVAPGEYELLPDAQAMINQVVKGHGPNKVIDRFLKTG
jgi:hypothetical protein